MPGLQPTQQDIDQFVSITQATPEDAKHFLSAGTTLEGAIEDYFAAQVEDEPPMSDTPPVQAVESPRPNPAAVIGARTLGGEVVESELPPGWGEPPRRMSTLTELTAPRPGSAPQNEDDEVPKPGETLYAGGEKSGLAIQNPDRGTNSRRIVDDILRQAADNTPSAVAARSNDIPSTAFGGRGNVLGTEDDPIPPGSPIPPPPSSSGGLPSGVVGIQPQQGRGEGEVQTRRLTFWKDGFSIENGPLHRYDDPGARDLLETIQAGRAPLSLFNVKYNQPLQLEVEQKTGENYVPPPKLPMKPFEGGGNRLGSPVPQVESSVGPRGGILESQNHMPGSFTTSSISGASTSSSTSGVGIGTGTIPTKFSVDESKPTTNVQLRLADGTRLVVKVNLTSTVGDLRGFVIASRSDNRRFVLQTTFPNRELTDLDETVESAKLQNAVVVQRYV